MSDLSRAVISFAVGLALVIPSGSRASELQATAVFAVARDPTAQKVAAVADALLRTRTERSRALRLVEPARVLSGDPRTREEETLERARAAFADGRRAYDALSLDEAIARLGQAVNLYQQTGPLLGDVEELQIALSYLGAALTLRGSPDEGESTFLELLTINSTYQPEGFPPIVSKTFEAASARIERAPTGGVEIFSTPPYAAVYLDGRFEGVTPVVLNDILAGTHYLRIEKVGYTVHGAPLEISPNQRITSQTRLRSMKKGAELRDITARCTEEVLADGMGGSLRALARMLVADTLIFVAVSQSGSDASFTGGVFDAATGSRVTTERSVLSVTSPAFVSELESFAARLVTSAEKGASADAAEPSGAGGSAFGLSQGSGTQAAHPGGGSGSSSALGGSSSWSAAPSGSPGLSTSAPPASTTQSELYLGWTLIGVGGAAVVTGTIFGALALGVHSDYRATSQASPDLGHIRDVGKTDALVADLCIGGGLLAVAGGVVTLLWLRGAGPTPEELLRNPRTVLAPTNGGGVISFEASFP